MIHAMISECWEVMNLKWANGRLAGGEGRLELMGMGLGGHGSMSGGSPDEIKQLAFANRWKKWKEYIRVKTP